MTEGHPEYGRRIADRVDKGTTPLPAGAVSRKVFLYANAFEALIAFSAIIAGITFFADPDSLRSTAIGQRVAPFDTMWNVVYILGGICTFAGLWLNRTRFTILVGNQTSGHGVELAGLIFLGVAVLANAIASYSVYGFTSGMMTFLAVVLACVARSYAILSTQKVSVPVEVPAGSAGSAGSGVT